MCGYVLCNYGLNLLRSREINNNLPMREKVKIREKMEEGRGHKRILIVHACREMDKNKMVKRKKTNEQI